jgi:hypothetical protein
MVIHWVGEDVSDASDYGDDLADDLCFIAIPESERLV